MAKRRLLPGCFAALGMLILILDSKTALTGARDGLELCIRTVIPSLFPFFLLSGILVSSLMGSSLPLLRPLGRALGIPKGGESLLIPAFLGGYPVGAGCIRDAWADGRLDRQDAQRLLAFSNNAGPAFLFGMAAPMFSHPAAGWVLWGIHIAGALFAGFCFRQDPVSSRISPSVPAGSASDLLGKALTVTARVCGWVILFRMAGSFLERWILFLLPDWGHAAVMGVLELANGCSELAAVAPESLRFLLCSGMLAFGGGCVTMQTLSVTHGLKLRYYFLGKFLQLMVSLLLSAICLGILSPVWLLVLPLAAVKKKGKSSSIPQPLGV